MKSAESLARIMVKVNACRERKRRERALKLRRAARDRDPIVQAQRKARQMKAHARKIHKLIIEEEQARTRKKLAKLMEGVAILVEERTKLDGQIADEEIYRLCAWLPKRSEVLGKEVFHELIGIMRGLGFCRTLRGWKKSRVYSPGRGDGSVKC